MAFYEDMAAMVIDVLSPTALGQTGIELIRETRLPPDPDAPWLGSEVEVERQVLKAAAKGVDQLADGINILSTDIMVTAAIPSIPWQLGPGVTLRVSINGVTYSVIAANTKPRAGTPVALELIVRDGRVDKPDPPVQGPDSQA